MILFYEDLGRGAVHGVEALLSLWEGKSLIGLIPQAKFVVRRRAWRLPFCRTQMRRMCLCSCAFCDFSERSLHLTSTCLKIIASLFSSMLKGKIEEMGFMTDTLSRQPNDKMTSYIQHTFAAYLRCTV